MSSAMIAGRYELGERLGYGGMSTVQVALDRRLERQVAVKLLAEHLADDSQFISRFKREALSAARLVHPNIVQVFDFGQDQASGRYYIVMEYIKGRSGAEILREETRLGVEDTLKLVDGACRGLVHAHRMGVIHRDVKPGNILVSDEGAVKLADFGIAKAMVGGTSQITQAGSVLGTAAYLAPEQASGAEVGPQADLYGLGVVTYQLLAGRLPYDAASLTELALMQQREYPMRLDELDPVIPQALAIAVQRALSLEPEQRYPSAEEMRRALHDGARGIAPAAAAPSTAATSLLATPDDTAATRAIPSERSRARSREPEPERPRRLQPQAPRTPPPPAYEPEIAEPVRSRRREPEPRRRGSASRAIAFVLLAGLVAAAIAFAIGSSSGGNGSVNITPVDGDSVSEVVEQTNQLIDDNTR
jgi:serine/threonine protein kinase